MPSRFDEAYASGTPPWDIGAPQPAFEAVAPSVLARTRDPARPRLSVLDAGCGTGENALLFARAGCDVVGVDSASLAIERAVAKAQARGLRASFLVADALELERLGRTFDVVLDSGLLHTFEDAEQASYVRSLQAVLRPQGSLLLMCMRDMGRAFSFGPRRLREEQLRAAFREGWLVESLVPAEFATNLQDREFGSAWLLTARRL